MIKLANWANLTKYPEIRLFRSVWSRATCITVNILHWFLCRVFLWYFYISHDNNKMSTLKFLATGCVAPSGKFVAQTVFILQDVLWQTVPWGWNFPHLSHISQYIIIVHSVINVESPCPCLPYSFPVVYHHRNLYMMINMASTVKRQMLINKFSNIMLFYFLFLLNSTREWLHHWMVYDHL